MIYDDILKIIKNEKDNFDSEDWDVKSSKDRYLIIFENRSNVECNDVKFLININNPFRYYVKSISNYKIDKTNKGVKLIDNLYITKIFLNLTLEYYENIGGNKLDPSWFKNKIEGLKNDLSKESFEKIKKYLNSFLNKREINTTDEILDKLREKINTTETKLNIENSLHKWNNDKGLYIALCYFPLSHTGERRINIDINRMEKIDEVIEYKIEDYLSKNINEIIASDEKEKSTYINLEDANALDGINKEQLAKTIEISVRDKKKKHAMEFLRILSELKSDGKKQVDLNEKIKNADLEEQFSEMFSAESNKWLISDGNRKVEEILNKFLEENIWIFGYDSNSEVLPHSKVLKQKRNNTWKPDLVVKRKDGNLDIYELKLSTDIIFGWDKSHKSYYTLAPLNKAVSQIENQHQYLLTSENENITKNDNLYIVIGEYQNELNHTDPDEIKYAEENGINRVEKKAESIQLLRNKYKNAKIIFYDDIFSNE